MKKILLVCSFIAVCNLSKAQWTQINTGITDSIPALTFSVVYKATNGDLYTSCAGFVGFSSIGGLYRSTNNGFNWTKQIDISSGGNGVLLERSGRLFRGINGGAGVEYSNDYGVTWSPASGISTGANIVTLKNSGDTLLAGSMTNGMFRSIDNGLTWTAINTGLTNTSVRMIAIKGSEIYVGTGIGGGVFKSTDKGNNWTAMNTGNTSNLQTDWIISAGTTLFIISGGQYYKSVDGAANWITFTAPGGLPTYGITFMYSNDQTSAIMGNAFEVYRTNDFGTTWENILFNLPTYNYFGFTAHKIQTIEMYNDVVWTGTLQPPTSSTEPGMGVYVLDTSGTLGLRENNIANEISLFPNPVSNRMMLYAGNKKIKSVIITDINGKTILNNEFSTLCNTQQCNVETLHPGLYLITCVFAEATSSTVKFIKN